MEQEPKVAATVLVLRDDPFEMLMVRRPAVASFASALVYPGGRVDPEDADPAWARSVRHADSLDDAARAIRIGAVREVFEETGLLLGAPEQLVSSGASFREDVERAGIVLDLDALVLFGHWITPPVQPRRYDTYFFLARAPEYAVAAVDGVELVDLEWIAPSEFVRRGATDLQILFPTLANATRLAESSDVASALATARARVPVTVQPLVARDDDGTMTVSVAPETGYSVEPRIITPDVRA